MFEKTLTLALLLVPAALRAEPSVAILPLGFAVEEFRGPGSYFAKTLPTSHLASEKLPREAPLVAVWGRSGGAAFHLDSGVLKQTRWHAGSAEGAPLHEAPRNAISGSRMQTGGALTVFLSEPRTEYRHGVFGALADAGRITIVEKQPLTGVSTQPRAVPTHVTLVEAGLGAVFEDLEPRLADLNGDGTPEIFVVKTDLKKGSSLWVIGKREGVWSAIAETPPIGEPKRWLNPAAVADFDGDGKPDIALVVTPHVAGMLQLWSFDGEKLALKHETPGYSNHAFGSAALENSAAVDVDGDGRPELVIPTLDRKALAILSLKDGIRELERIPLPGAVAHGVAALGSGKDTHILAALADGRVVLVRP